MFIGHFAVAFATKRLVPQVSLGTLFMASQFIDLLWPVFLLTGIEEAKIDPGNTATVPLDFAHYPYSHSLIFVIFWAAIVGGGHFLLLRRKLAAFVVAALVISHWFLDLLVHAPDLPIFPGSAKFGFGLWDHLPLALLIELSLFSFGAWLYSSTTQPQNEKGRLGFYALSIFLVTIHLVNVLGPPPPSIIAVAVVGNTLWLLVLAAIFVDRNRKIV